MTLGICLFLPTFIGLKIYAICLEKKNFHDLFLSYVVIATITNILTMLIYHYAFHYNSLNASMYIGMITRYMLVASIISILCSIMMVIIEKNISMKVVVKKNEKSK